MSISPDALDRDRRESTDEYAPLLDHAGLLSVAQARRQGLSRHDLNALVGSRTLVRVVPGVFTTRQLWTAAKPERKHGLRSRAVLAQTENKGDEPEGRALSHSSAAAVHGLPLLASPRRVHMMRTDGGPPRCRRGFILHQRLEGLRTEKVDGVMCVPPALAAVGVAQVHGLTAGVAALDAALHQGVATKDEAWRWLRRLGGHRGVRAAEAAVEHSDGRAESPQESRARVLLEQLGYSVEPQPELMTPQGVFVARVDLRLKGGMVVVEVDGLSKYLDDDGKAAARTLRREKDREHAIRDLGYEMVRFDARSLGDVALVRRRIEAAKRRARSR